MKKIYMITLLAIGAFAHTPIMSCIDEGDGTITCEGGFSDGSSAGGVAFKLEQKGQVILNEKLNSQSEINFEKPNDPFIAIFDAGPQHEVYIKSQDIKE